MEVCVLGSGSAGNATALRMRGRLLLVDAGFGPRATAARLARRGAALEDVQALLLTHVDRDHFRPSWLPLLLKRAVRLYCHRRHLHPLYALPPAGRSRATARRLHEAGLLRPFDDDALGVPLGTGLSVRVRPVRLAHDRAGSVGFRLSADGLSVGYATDLGRVPPALLETLTDVQLLALESNYDPSMQRASQRPLTLKRRIMGGSGHLSNEQALRAAEALFERSRTPPNHLVLLHLSRQCNSPQRIRHLYEKWPQLAARLCLTSQVDPSPWLHVAARPAHEPMLFPC